jgi:flagellar hook-associated protein 3 FlgL
VCSSDLGSPTAILTEAKTALTTLISTLNVSDGASHVFAGINSDTAPITDFFGSGTPANKKAVDDAFLANFGFSQSDPRVSTITPDQMKSFLQGPMAALYSQANWAQNWSTASDEAVQSRISVSRTTATSITANESAFRDLASGYSMLSAVGLESLSPAAYQAAIETATKYIQSGVSKVTQLQAGVGSMQSALASASQTMSAQKDLLNTQIGALENVDPTEAAARVNSLMTQIETAYSLTAQLRNLSLAKYL